MRLSDIPYHIKHLGDDKPDKKPTPMSFTGAAMMAMGTPTASITSREIAFSRTKRTQGQLRIRQGVSFLPSRPVREVPPTAQTPRCDQTQYQWKHLTHAFPFAFTFQYYPPGPGQEKYPEEKSEASEQARSLLGIVCEDSIHLCVALMATHLCFAFW